MTFSSERGFGLDCWITSVLVFICAIFSEHRPLMPQAGASLTRRSGEESCQMSNHSLDASTDKRRSLRAHQYGCETNRFAVAANPAIAQLLQSTRPVGWVS